MPSTKSPTTHVVLYHSDSDGLWAESPSVTGWSATAETVEELHRLAEEGIKFALGDENVEIQHLAEGASILHIARQAERPGGVPCLALADPTTGSGVRIVPLKNEWLRVGRSLGSDLRLDDPSVSRRHALFVRMTDGVRVLDDRSQTGVFVNGDKVEWSVLSDGDEIIIGRYRIFFLDHGEA